MATEITVLICTRNRADQLKQVLETAASMTVPDGLAWELIVIDNGSSDHTADVVRSFEGRLPVRRVLEPKAGLSNARNRGVAEARGAYICWTDDDVMIDPAWLSSYAAAFKAYPEAAVFGGVIEPFFTPPTPQGLLDNLHNPIVGDVMARRDFGPDPVPLSVHDHTLPYGANFAIRTTEQRKHLYDPNLGVSPTHRRLGEETQVITAIMKRGGSGMWTPRAKVRHIIPQARQTRKYIAQYYQLLGETEAYLEQEGHPDQVRTGKRILGLPMWRLRALITLSVAVLVAKITGNDAARLNSSRDFAVNRGYIAFVLRGH